MEKLIKNNKLILSAIVVVLFFFLWGQTAGFRLLRNDKGSEWSPQGNSNSIHHK